MALLGATDDSRISPHGDAAPASGDDPRDLAAVAEDLPVVARMVVEIRSDGTRTVARGALQDHHDGAEVAVRAEGASPLALAMSLARALTRLPALAAGRSLSAPRKRPGLRGALRRIAGRLGGRTR